MEITPQVYDIRNEDKKYIQQKKAFLQITAGEIRLYKVGVNIGNEVSKHAPHVRPCIILNEHVEGDLTLIAPLTSQKKRSKYYIVIKNSKLYGLSTVSCILISHIRTVSIKRLVCKLNGFQNNTGRIKLVPQKILTKIKYLYISRILKIQKTATTSR